MKSTAHELQAKLAGARDRVPVGTSWLHKKGGQYRVLGHSIDTDTGDVRIRYAHHDGPGYDQRAEEGIEFSRPYVEWSVDRFIQLP